MTPKELLSRCHPRLAEFADDAGVPLDVESVHRADNLLKFVVLEMHTTDTFDPDRGDDGQVEKAVRLLREARDRLDGMIHSLARQPWK